MPRPTADDLRSLLTEVAAMTGVSTAEICGRRPDPAAVTARRRFMRAARMAGATQAVIAEALGGSITPCRVSQILIDDRPEMKSAEDAVRRIVEAVTAETGLTTAEVCSTGKASPEVIARRLVIGRARAEGISNSAIARVLSQTPQCVMRTAARVKAAQASMPSDPLAAFRRRGEYVPLTEVDYAQRAGLTQPVARAVLDELRVRRMVVMTEDAKYADLRIFDVVPAARGAGT